MNAADRLENLDALFDREGYEPSRAPHLPEAEPLDAELPADVFYLSRRRTEVASEVRRVDARIPVIHNSFFVPGKVPSLNDLLDAKSKNQPILRSIIMRQRPKKGKGDGARYSLYNDIKQDWSSRTIHALGAPFVRVEGCYFGYVIVEETLKRDPSNVCSAAIKFIEDGLVKAGAIPNDGWGNVLGIRMTVIHRPGRPPGVYVVMSDTLLLESELVVEYEDHLLSFI